MAALRVRVYNVLFGDAILVSIPERGGAGEVIRHMLIDLGNALTGAGGADEVFLPVLEDILAQTGGAPLDLYVMTHEHMDHVQGPLHGMRRFGHELKARHVWMTASSDPGYYDDPRFPEARKQRALALEELRGISEFVTNSAAPVSAGLATMLEINNPRASADCVAFIRGMTGAPLYVHREAGIDGHHPFTEARLRLLAPEHDTAIYYRKLGPRLMGVSASGAPTALQAGRALVPPAGVAAGDFFDLVQFRASGMADNLRAIDKAANNTSVVIELEWRGWRLLFPGDAEERSWELMARRNLLRPVHFLKVSHHGSENGSPGPAIDALLPADPPDDRPRQAVVSTREGAYPGVPDPHTLDLIASRARLQDTRDVAPGGWIDVTFEDRGPGGGP